MRGNLDFFLRRMSLEAGKEKIPQLRERPPVLAEDMA